MNINKAEQSVELQAESRVNDCALSTPIIIIIIKVIMMMLPQDTAQVCFAYVLSSSPKGSPHKPQQRLQRHFSQAQATNAVSTCFSFIMTPAEGTKVERNKLLKCG